MPKPTRVVVLQDGGRLHYAVPVALHRQNLLERVFCDWYSSPFSMQRAAGKMMRTIGMGLGQRMLDRYTPDLTGARIITNPRLTLRGNRLKKNLPTEQAYFRQLSHETSQWIRQAGVGNATAFFGFIRNMDPALGHWMKQQGLFTVGDQIIAPHEVQIAEEVAQRNRYPEFPTGPLPESENWWAGLERETWDALDHITCASEYVRTELVARGIAPSRITVNPYPINPDDFPYVDRSNRDCAKAISVGFVGGVNLRKGTPQFWQVAKNFDPGKVKFTMVGPVNIHPAAIEKYRGDVELPGAVARSEIPGWLGRFDIYFFPSTCEGSAGSVIEAMSTGLPVVTSPNSGTVIEHGQSGYIFPYTAVDQYTQAIQELADDRALRLQMGNAGRQRIQALGLDHFADTMANMLQHHLAER